MTSSMLDLGNLKVNDNYKVYFTYNDIKHLPEFPEGPLIELLNGEIFIVPSPKIKHQKISQNLSLEIGILLKSQNIGIVFIAPVDVVLSAKNVVVPDLLFVKKENKHIITEKNISGTPDFIIEILSDNRTNDLVIKKDLYEKFRVGEYWIVDPIDETILKYVLVDNKYELENKYDKSSGQIKIDVMGFTIALDNIFS